MTRSTRRFLPLVIVGLGVARLAGAQQQFVFRSTTDQVSIDVAVHRGSNPVTGLTTADFRLEDNGVAQTIEAVSSDALPIDVTLVMDMSASVVGEIATLTDRVRQIAGLIRPTDRVRVVTFGVGVQQLRPMTPASEPVRPGLIVLEDGTSMNDGVFYALAWPAEPGRRHLVVVFTDGDDTMSTLGQEALVEIAARSDAVLHVMLAAPSRRKGVTSREALIEAATRTGGGPHKLGDAVKSFKEVFDEFRSSYVLQYTLRGVIRDGWHDVTVKVTRPGSFTIRARKGYFAG